MRPEISIEYLRECLSYDALTGELTWLPRPRGHFKSASAYGNFVKNYQGKVAGSKAKDWYVQVTIDCQLYLGHRIAWALHTGAWPTEKLDHWDRVKSNNAFDNLRLATWAENAANSARVERRHLKGVNKVGNSGRFYAQAMVDGRYVRLGVYDSEQKAHDRYCRFMRLLYGKYFYAG